MRYIIVISLVFLLCGCSVGTVESVRSLDKPTELYAPIPTSAQGIADELKTTRARVALLQSALQDAKDSELQTKIWVGVGALVLAGIVLIGLGIWTTHKILISFGVAALGLAGLGTLAAWLVPYLIYIGIAVALAVITAAIYMLKNREKALTQVTQAVDTAKDRIPAFALGYANIFREHIDTDADKVVNAVRNI